MKRFVVCWLFLFAQGWLATSAWSQEKEKPFLVLNAGGHTGRIWDVAFFPGGKELITVSYDKTIRIWNLEDGSSQRTLRPPIGPGSEGRLICAALSPDGTLLATGGTGVAEAKNSIYIISLISGEMKRVLRGHTGTLNSVAFSPDGKLLGSAANDGTARIWDVAAGTRLHVLEGHKHLNVNAIAFSADSRWAGTVSADKTARIWSAGTGEEKAVLRHDGGVLWLAFAPDDSTVATVAGNCVCLWTRQGKFLRESDRKAYLCYCEFTRDSKQIFYAGGANGLFSPASGEIHEITAKEMSGGALSPDGKRVVTVNTAGTVFLWNAKDGRLIRSLAGDSRPLWSAGWGQDGNTVVFGTEGEPSGRSNVLFPLSRFFRADVLELTDAAAADSRRTQLVQKNLRLAQVDDTTVVVKDDQKEIHRLAVKTLGTGDDKIRCFTFLDARRAVVGNNNGRVLLFNVQTGRLEREFQGHVGEVWAVAPSPDGRYVLSASNDHTLRIWQPDQDEPLLSLFFARDDWIAWTPQGYYAASPGGERLMGWQVNNGLDKMATFHSAGQFRKSLYRPDVIKLLLGTGSVEKALTLANQQRGKAANLVEVAEVLPPLVFVTTPDRAKVETADASIEIRALARALGKHPITGLRLLVNGRPHGGKDGIISYAPARAGEVRETWQLELVPGANTVQVHAESAVSKALSEPVEIIRTKDGGGNLPNLYVLAIGVSAYPKEDMKLKYAAKDAQVLAKTFQATSHGLYKNVEVKVRTDKDATRRNILQGLAGLRKQMTQRDVAIVSFAGHGDKDSDGHLYLFPVDVDESDLISSAVPADQVKNALGGMPGRLILLLDACHAGAIGSATARGGSLTDDLVRDLATDDYGVIVMCSSTGREFSLESSTAEHGFFTLAVVEGLKGKADYNKDQVVQWQELDQYVTGRVKELSQGQQHPVTTRPASVRSFALSRP